MVQYLNLGIRKLNSHWLHLTLHTLHLTLYTPHFTLYTPHFTLCTPNHHKIQCTNDWDDFDNPWLRKPPNSHLDPYPIAAKVLPSATCRRLCMGERVWRSFSKLPGRRWQVTFVGHLEKNQPESNFSCTKSCLLRATATVIGPNKKYA